MVISNESWAQGFFFTGEKGWGLGVLFVGVSNGDSKRKAMVGEVQHRVSGRGAWKMEARQKARAALTVSRLCPVTTKTVNNTKRMVNIFASFDVHGGIN